MSRAASSPLARFWPLLSLLVLTAVVGLATSAGSLSLAQTGTNMLVNLVIVVGLYTFIGNTGLFSFGHTAFLAVGAYVTALLTIPADTKLVVLPSLPHALQTAHVPALAAVLIGGLAAVALAAFVGAPIVRMAPLPASLATFGVLAIVYNVASNWQAIGGSTGLSEVPQNTTLYLALVWALLAISVAFAYQGTRACLRVRAAREDEVAARSIGAPVARDRFVALLLSAFIVGVAGGVFAQNLGSFTPDAFFLDAAFVTIVMLLVGGMTSLAGAVVGTLVISAVQEGLRHVESGLNRPGIQSVVLALLLIAVMVKRPLGLMAGKELHWPFGRAARSAPEGDHASALGATQGVATAGEGGAADADPGFQRPDRVQEPSQP
jgi:branched-chain amino acid transport system permease protein